MEIILIMNIFSNIFKVVRECSLSILIMNSSLSMSFPQLQNDQTQTGNPWFPNEIANL